MKRIMIIVIFTVVLAAVAGVLIMLRANKGVSIHAPNSVIPIENSYPPLPTDRQMFDFIVSQARIVWTASPVSLRKEKYSPLADAVDTWWLSFGDDEGFMIYCCRDSIAKEKLEIYFQHREATKFRAIPLTKICYGNMIMEHYKGIPFIVDFMKSVVIDTREGMVLTLRWQKWLAERGVEIKISDSGFGLLNHSLLESDSAIHQTLPLSIDGNKMELICCADANSAQQTLDSFTHMSSVMDRVIGADIYKCQRYDRFLVMLVYNENYERNKSLVEEFWNKQNLN